MKTIKVLCLIAVTTLGLVVLPSMASAQGGVEADTYPVIYHGTVEQAPKFYFAGSSIVTCSNAEISGQAAGPTNDLGSIPGMTCKREIGSEQALKMNGCKFIFHPGASSSMDIGPAGCGPITNMPLECEPTFPAQTGIPVSYENVTVEGVERIRATVNTQILANVNWACGGGTYHIYFTGTWMVVGLDANGNFVDIRRGDALDGFFISGKKSENPAEQPRFTAQSYPDPITGSLNSGETVNFKFNGGVEIACSSAGFSADLTSAVTSLPLTTTLSGCVRNDSKTKPPVTVAMNSCRISYGLSNVDYVPPLAYKGTVGVDCTKAGDYIRLTFESCETRVPAQTPGTSSVIYSNTNLGEGANQFVTLGQASASSLTHYYESGFCTLLGKEHKDGTLTIGKGSLHGI